MTGAFEPPVYPYERLDYLRTSADELAGGQVDCSIGTPCDPPPDVVLRALAGSRSERRYPPSIGTEQFRSSAAGWLQQRFSVNLDAERQIAACIGSKEFVASLPRSLRLRWPQRDTVLYPAVSYPSYAMGATLARCRAMPVPVDEQCRVVLSSIDPQDARRALCLWINTPGNPAGGLDDLEAAAAWGREHGVLVVSDECYVEFTWSGPPRTILEQGADGVLAVHSLSKRSNLAGLRVGFYAGDSEIVHFLREVRKHAGCMVAGPVQAAAAAAWADQTHVVAQRELYRQRLQMLRAIAVEAGAEQVSLPAGAFYLWVRAPGGDAWAFAEMLASRAGLIVSPGEFYCDHPEAGGSHDPRAFVRIAAVQPEHRLKLALERLRARTA